MNTFEAWINTAANIGPRTFYNLTWCDYPPVNIYFFWGLGSVAKAFSLFGTPSMTYLIKFFPNLFDIAISILVFIFVRKRLDFKKALLATALYAFNPAVIFNAAVWGQFDAIYTFFLVLSLALALASKPTFSAVAFTIAVLTKPQSIAIAPLILFLILKKHGWKRLIISLSASVATILLLILPFEWSNPISFLTKIYFGAYKGYAYTSVNAFNLWAFGGLWAHETPFLLMLGWILFGALATFVLYLIQKRLSFSGDFLVLFSAFILFFGFFMLPTRIHERYLFPTISIMALLFVFLKKIRPIYAILTSTCFINQAYVLYWLNAYADAGYDYGPNLTGDPVVILVALINLIVFLYVLVLMWDELKDRSWLTKKAVQIDNQVSVKTNGNENLGPK